MVGFFGILIKFERVNYNLFILGGVGIFKFRLKLENGKIDLCRFRIFIFLVGIFRGYLYLRGSFEG